MKKDGSIFSLLYGIAGAALGAILLLSSGAEVLSFLTKLIGTVMLIINLPRVIALVIRGDAGHRRMETCVYISGTVIGAVVFFLPVAAVTVASVLAGVWFIVLPVVDIIGAQYRREQFKAELPKILIGMFLIILGPTVLFSVLAKILGGAIFVFSMIYLVRVIASFPK
jgi:uncharacterized membrane protein HdeD (DUF308 family)